MKQKLACIAVDDEPLALELIKSYIQRTPFLELQEASLSATEALGLVNSDTDIVFLDINMPELTGLELAAMMPPHVKIVFTTAYREYAVDSYSVHAADYLLKPLSYPRFLQTASMLRDSLAEAENNEHSGEVTDYIFVKCDYKLVRIDFSDVLYLKGLKDYVSIYLRGRKTPLIATSTMKQMEEKLPSPRFCRVHKSYIVAMGAVEAVERSRISIGEELIPISDAYRNNFFSILEQ